MIEQNNNMAGGVETKFIAADHQVLKTLNWLKKRSSDTVVVSTYSSGTSWYRIWSDGLIEQGGHVDAKSEEITITLIKSFSDTKYKAMVTPTTLGHQANWNPGIKSKNTTKFIYHSMVAAACGCDWYALGY